MRRPHRSALSRGNSPRVAALRTQRSGALTLCGERLIGEERHGRVIAPDELSSDQRTFLLYGPDDRCGDAFDSEDEVRAAWEKHKEHLLADYAIGRRPWAWRALDYPHLRWRGFDREQADLWRAGVLGIAERIALEAMWREDFERGRDLKSVPRELVRQWKKAQRQQKEKPPSKVITEGLESA
jgi:hypothetical protein